MPKLTIEVIMNEIKHLQKDIKDGFSGVHTRQDIANGKLAKHEGLIIELEKADIEMGNRFKLWRWNWILAGLLITVIVGLLGRYVY